MWSVVLAFHLVWCFQGPSMLQPVSAHPGVLVWPLSGRSGGSPGAGGWARLQHGDGSTALFTSHSYSDHVCLLSIYLFYISLVWGGAYFAEDETGFRGVGMNWDVTVFGLSLLGSRAVGVHEGWWCCPGQRLKRGETRTEMWRRAVVGG